MVACAVALLYAFTGRWLPLAFIRQCSTQWATGKANLLQIVLQDFWMVEPDMFPLVLQGACQIVFFFHKYVWVQNTFTYDESLNGTMCKLHVWFNLFSKLKSDIILKVEDEACYKPCHFIPMNQTEHVFIPTSLLEFIPLKV